MSEQVKTALEKMVGLARIDANCARLLATRQQHIEAVHAKREEAVALQQNAVVRRQAHKEKQVKYQREESRLKHEQDKLVDRRKALTALTNHKLQMAANKEIEAAGRTLAAQEEVLIGMLDTLDELNAAATTAEETFTTSNSEYEALTAELKEEVLGIDERLKEHTVERQSLAEGLTSGDLQRYQKAQKRYPTNPVVLIAQNCCQGCHMQLGPQAIVEVMRFSKIVECRSCGRILCGELTEEE